MARGMPELRDLGRPTRPDAGNRNELLLRRRKNVEESSEPAEQYSRGCGGDTRCRCQSLLGGREQLAAARSLSINGSVTCRCSLAARQDAQNPVRGIAGVLAPADGDPEIGDRENQSSHRFGRKTAVIQRQTFDQEVRPAGSVAKLPDLRPETPFGNRLMEVWNALAFDQGDVIEAVVPGGEPTLINLCPEPDQFAGDTGCPLVNIDDHTHLSTLPRQMRRNPRDAEKKASLLAISQSEMA